MSAPCCAGGPVLPWPRKAGTWGSRLDRVSETLFEALFPRTRSLPCPAPALLPWHYRLYNSKQRAPQQSLSHGIRKPTTGHPGCLFTEAGNRAEKAARGGRVTQLSAGTSRHRERGAGLGLLWPPGLRGPDLEPPAGAGVGQLQLCLPRTTS